MAEPTKTSQEPSMEEILSSIRRIIADEDGGDPPPSGAIPPAGRGERTLAGPAAPARPPAPDGDDDEEVLELTEIVEPARQDLAPPQPSPPTAAPQRPAAPPPQPRARTEEPMRSTAPTSSADGVDGLLSRSSADASAQALAKLTRAAGGGEDRGQSPLAQVTVERLLADLLTPVLKDWLDQNLPQIVERVVEQEVKKLARRAELL